MKKEWTDKLKDRLSDYEESVPERLWEDIESTLSRRVTSAGISRKKSSTTLLRRTIIIATAAAAAVLICYMLTTGNNISDRKGTATATERNITDIAACPAAVQENRTQTPVTTAGNTIRTANSRIAGNTTLAENTREGVTNVTTSNATGQQTSAPAQAEKDKSGKRNNTTNSNASRRDYRHGMYPATMHTGTNANSRISLGLYAQNVAVSASRMPQQNSPLLYSSPSGYTPGAASDGEQHSGINMMFTRNTTNVLRVKHDFPIRAGLSVSYKLNDRTSLESGVTYTLLKSQITSGNENRHNETRQRLHYIGIPLNIRYTVWRGKRLEAYISGGGEIQKCVAGKSETESNINGTATSSASGTIKDNRLQTSVNASAGLQYNISPAIGIYAEPGIGWHPDNGSAVETIYKEKPVNFSIKAGVRVNVGGKR